LGVGLLNGLKASEGAFIVEVVEVLVSLADLGGEVDGVSVVGGLCDLNSAVEGVTPLTGRGVVGVRKGRTRKQEDEEEPEIFDAAYYRDSPRPDVVPVEQNTYFLMQISMIRVDGIGSMDKARCGSPVDCEAFPLR
jgi:hypothetical protein